MSRISRGIPATLAYDGCRLLLVNFGRFRIKPFETFVLFGYLIGGSEISRSFAMWIGTLYHYVNGECFAIAYVILFGTREWRLASVWALFLEALMLTVYPGWLNLRAVIAEFTIISLSGHIVYGTVLGLVARSLMDRHGSSGNGPAAWRT